MNSGSFVRETLESTNAQIDPSRPYKFKIAP